MYNEIEVIGKQFGVDYQLIKLQNDQELSVYQFKITSNEDFVPEPVKLRWKIPCVNVKGVWKSSIDYNKRLQYDWELDHLKSRISVDAPVVGVFGHEDMNVSTFSCSDAINTVEMNALLREEDNSIYCHLSFFTEKHPAIRNYEVELRIDQRKISCFQALRETALWWESFEELTPAFVPKIAKTPLYSTWYQYHQNLDQKILLEECKTASELGYEVIIVDDGWQTMDTNRGYDYTGDWKPDRIPNMKSFVDEIHDLGMKIGFWYSVPFCGKKSQAYQQFRGKFLTEDHRWAPVFDPRYPEVRQYLINIYKNAVIEWGIDGFKLDFIDDFIAYPETVLTKEDGRDFASVNKGVSKLLSDVLIELRSINPDIFIEFRQQYIGPAVRHFGNMFRAFDCPNDSNTNRVRICDVKLLSGNCAVHSDPLTWNISEPVEIAALQFINAIFGVPQLSMEISKLPLDHLDMVRFYTEYWNSNKNILSSNNFSPIKPLSGYPIIRSDNEITEIVALYEDMVVDIDSDLPEYHILNGKTSKVVMIRFKESYIGIQTIYDCRGSIISENQFNFSRGLHELDVPAAGLIKFQRT